MTVNDELNCKYIISIIIPAVKWITMSNAKNKTNAKNVNKKATDAIKKVAPKVKKKLIEKKEPSLLWAGGAKLMSKSKTQQDQEVKNTIFVISSLLNVSPLGVVVLGGLPYLNKLARKEKLDQYGAGGWRVKYKWAQIAKNDTDKAICQACVVDDKSKEVSEWVIGEASPATIKMGTLAGYQNHLAQTRAHNRVIEEHIGLRIHREMLENIAKRQKTGETVEVPMIDTSVSAEEMQMAQTQPQPQAKQALTVNTQQAKFKCQTCHKEITKQVADYSKGVYKKSLCRGCQPAKKK